MSFNRAEFFRPRTAGRPWPGVLTWVFRPLYLLYEARLARQTEGQPVPRHIGIILDGNRRHAVRNGVTEPNAIYTFGANKLDHVLDRCADLDVPAVTRWVVAPDTLDRPGETLSGT